VAVAGQHLPADVPGNVHDGLVTGPAFAQFRNQRVAVIVPAPRDTGILPDVAPDGL
jgi:hypothetical protein